MTFMRRSAAASDPPGRSSSSVSLSPTASSAALVRAALVLGHVALVPALHHMLPRLQPVRRQPAHGEDQLTPGHDVLQLGAAITERSPGQRVGVFSVARNPSRSTASIICAAVTRAGSKVTTASFAL